MYVHRGADMNTHTHTHTHYAHSVSVNEYNAKRKTIDEHISLFTSKNNKRKTAIRQIKYTISLRFVVCLIDVLVDFDSSDGLLIFF